MFHLLLNYFGQGALLLADPVQNPFYRLAPDWGCTRGPARVGRHRDRLPRRCGAFSLTRQARSSAICRVRCGIPPLRKWGGIRTGSTIYPSLRWFDGPPLPVSDALGAAYGIAVTGTMTVGTSLPTVFRSQLVVAAHSLFWCCRRRSSVFGAICSSLRRRLVPAGDGGNACTIMTAWMWGRTPRRAARQRRAAAADAA